MWPPPLLPRLPWAPLSPPPPLLCSPSSNPSNPTPSPCRCLTEERRRKYCRRISQASVHLFFRDAAKACARYILEMSSCSVFPALRSEQRWFPLVASEASELFSAFRLRVTATRSPKATEVKLAEVELGAAEGGFASLRYALLNPVQHEQCTHHTHCALTDGGPWS